MLTLRMTEYGWRISSTRVALVAVTSHPLEIHWLMIYTNVNGMGIRSTTFPFPMDNTLLFFISLRFSTYLQDFTSFRPRLTLIFSVFRFSESVIQGAMVAEFSMSMLRVLFQTESTSFNWPDPLTLFNLLTTQQFTMDFSP